MNPSLTQSMLEATVASTRTRAVMQFFLTST